VPLHDVECTTLSVAICHTVRGALLCAGEKWSSFNIDKSANQSEVQKKTNLHHGCWSHCQCLNYVTGRIIYSWNVRA